MGLFHLRNLIAMRKALDLHNTNCPEPASAILLNPIDHGLLGWEELWGLPVLADDAVRVKKIQIQCDGDTREYARDLPDE
jgi:hypothetical protein